MDWLSGLNEQQRQAVTAGQGPILVMAGPGSGKTRVLTQRIAYVIHDLGIPPYRILAVTFTNKAAREMEKRVSDILLERTRGLTLGTFHAICAQILRREAEHLPVNSNFVIFDADDQLKVVKQALNDLNLDDKRFRPQSMHAGISFAKNELRSAEDVDGGDQKSRTLANVFRRYQQLLLASNAVDFDDLLLYTARLLEDEPAVRQKYAGRYAYVLVDEFQDTNTAQYEIVKNLASTHGNIFVVGDADQSIYRWRGADYRNVQRFKQDFKDTRVILLEENYRSTQHILDVAMKVIDGNPNRTRKQLHTRRGEGERVVLAESYTDRDEAEFVVTRIVEMARLDKVSLGSFAVMYRTNAQSRVIEEAFLHHNVPYKIVGAQRFYGRREIKDVLAYLRIVHNPRDEVSLLRAINTPPRKIGEKTMDTLRREAQKRNLSSGDFILQAAPAELESCVSTAAGRALLAFRQKWQAWQDASAALQADLAAVDEDNGELPPPGGGVAQLIDRILDDAAYRPYIDDGSEEGAERWENVMELRRLAAEREDLDLGRFLEQVALVADQDTLQNSADVPVLLTLHAAKGLEFPVVFIVGVNDGVIPHIRSFDDNEAMMEERRLFYVGITRAEDRLYLLYAQMGGGRGFTEALEPSRYLDEIPTDLLSVSRPESMRSRRIGTPPARTFSTPVGGMPRWESAQPDKPADATPKNDYQPGMRVEHDAWGIGLILNVKEEDGDQILDIYFEGAGLKRVVGSFAKLQIMA